MLRLILHWLLSAVALLIVARIVPGFVVNGLFTALVAVAIIGLVNATLGLLLKIATFPLTIITLGIFWFVINALMIEFASWFVPGFHVNSFGAAFVGAIVLALLNMILRTLFRPARRYE